MEDINLNDMTPEKWAGMLAKATIEGGSGGHTYIALRTDPKTGELFVREFDTLDSIKREGYEKMPISQIVQISKQKILESSRKDTTKKIKQSVTRVIEAASGKIFSTANKVKGFFLGLITLAIVPIVSTLRAKSALRAHSEEIALARGAKTEFIESLEGRIDDINKKLTCDGTGVNPVYEQVGKEAEATIDTSLNANKNEGHVAPAGNPLILDTFYRDKLREGITVRVHDGNNNLQLDKVAEGLSDEEKEKHVQASYEKLRSIIPEEALALGQMVVSQTLPNCSSRPMQEISAELVTEQLRSTRQDAYQDQVALKPQQTVIDVEVQRDENGKFSHFLVNTFVEYEVTSTRTTNITEQVEVHLGTKAYAASTAEVSLKAPEEAAVKMVAIKYGVVDPNVVEHGQAFIQQFNDNLASADALKKPSPTNLQLADIKEGSLPNTREYIARQSQALQKLQAAQAVPDLEDSLKAKYSEETEAILSDINEAETDLKNLPVEIEALRNKTLMQSMGESIVRGINFDVQTANDKLEAIKRKLEQGVALPSNERQDLEEELQEHTEGIVGSFKKDHSRNNMSASIVDGAYSSNNPALKPGDDAKAHLRQLKANLTQSLSPQEIQEWWPLIRVAVSQAGTCSEDFMSGLQLLKEYGWQDQHEKSHVYVSIPSGNIPITCEVIRSPEGVITGLGIISDVNTVIFDTVTGRTEEDGTPIARCHLQGKLTITKDAEGMATMGEKKPEFTVDVTPLI